MTAAIPAPETDKTIFVGRDFELERLVSLLRKGATGSGGVLFLEGSQGIGKSALLRQLEELTQQSRDFAETVYVTAYCSRQDGSKNPYYPFSKAYEQLSNRKLFPNMADRVTAAVQEVMTAWLPGVTMGTVSSKSMPQQPALPHEGQAARLQRRTLKQQLALLTKQYAAVNQDLLTTIDPELQVVLDLKLKSLNKKIKAVERNQRKLDKASQENSAALGGTLSAPATAVAQLFSDSKQQADQSVAFLSRLTDALIEIADLAHPLILVLEEGQWIDESSCRLLQRLAERAQDHNLVIVVTYQPEEVTMGNPLFTTRNDLQGSGLAQLLSLEPWSKDQILTYLEKRFSSVLDPNLADWLDFRCSGVPSVVVDYLDHLEQKWVIAQQGGHYLFTGTIKQLEGEWKLDKASDNLGASEDIGIPASVKLRLQQRIEDSALTEDDKRLLEVGSVQGYQFISLITAALVQKTEPDTTKQLRSIKEREGLIDNDTGYNWLKRRSEVYHFEPSILQTLLYERLPLFDKQDYHYKVAEALKQLLTDQSGAPRDLILKIAGHYEAAEEALLSAQYYYIAAQSAFAIGGFSEATEICRIALTEVRGLDSGKVEHDTLRCQLIMLLLVASEVEWVGKPEQQGALPLGSLLDEAEAAATRTGDLSLQAQVKFAKGKALIATESLADAITVMNEALELARDADNAQLEFAIMSHLGNITNSQSLEKGLRLEYDAYKLYQSKLAGVPGSASPELKRHFFRLQGFIGIGEFDRGDFGTALKWLNESVAGLRSLNMRYDLPRYCNYLGQFYTVLGLFEEAEKVFKEGIQAIPKVGSPSAWHGYNLAQLGKLYLEWQRVEDAAEPICRGWEETQVAANVDLVQLVRNVYCELLMNPQFNARDMDEANRLLAKTIEEAKKANVHHSAIRALSLRGQLRLQQKLVDEAVTYSTEAVTYLQSRGTLPTLREEEALFNHYLVLKAASRGDEANDYLRLANDILQRKTRSITSDAQRDSFLKRVQISQAIIAAVSGS